MNILENMKKCYLIGKRCLVFEQISLSQQQVKQIFIYIGDILKYLNKVFNYIVMSHHMKYVIKHRINHH